MCSSRLFKIIVTILIGIFIGHFISYAFVYPEKTQTQLFLDLVTGKTICWFVNL